MADSDLPELRKHHKSALTEQDEKELREFGAQIPMRQHKKDKQTIGLDFSKMEKKRGQKYCPNCGKFTDVKRVDSTNENVPSKRVCYLCRTFIEFIPRNKS